jgi:outer membrane protein assembly factor BamE (lipoprotein component of BamABCDE complex)
MKTTLIALLLAALGVAATGCSSASLNRVATHSTHSLGLPLDEVPSDEGAGQRTLLLQPGNSRDAVLTQLGVPKAAPNEDVWIYTDARSPDTGSRLLDFDTLVVTFSEERVSQLRLVNGNQARDALARQEAKPTPPARLAQVP